jgi:toxin FitB
MYLLDTNILSESRKLGNARIDPHLAKWLAQIDVEASYISAMTIYEIKRGVRGEKNRSMVPAHHQQTRQDAFARNLPGVEPGSFQGSPGLTLKARAFIAFR